MVLIVSLYSDGEVKSIEGYVENEDMAKQKIEELNNTIPKGESYYFSFKHVEKLEITEYQAVIYLSDGTEINSEKTEYMPTFQQIRKGLIFWGGVAYRLDEIKGDTRKQGKRIEAIYE